MTVTCMHWTGLFCYLVDGMLSVSKPVVPSIWESLHDHVNTPIYVNMLQSRYPGFINFNLSSTIASLEAHTRARLQGNKAYELYENSFYRETVKFKGHTCMLASIMLRLSTYI